MADVVGGKELGSHINNGTALNADSDTSAAQKNKAFLDEIRSQSSFGSTRSGGTGSVSKSVGSRASSQGRNAGNMDDALANTHSGIETKNGRRGRKTRSGSKSRESDIEPWSGEAVHDGNKGQLEEKRRSQSKRNSKRSGAKKNVIGGRSGAITSVGFYDDLTDRHHGTHWDSDDEEQASGHRGLAGRSGRAGGASTSLGLHGGAGLSKMNRDEPLRSKEMKPSVFGQRGDGTRLERPQLESRGTTDSAQSRTSTDVASLRSALGARMLPRHPGLIGGGGRVLEKAQTPDTGMFNEICEDLWDARLSVVLPTKPTKLMPPTGRLAISNESHGDKRVTAAHDDMIGWDNTGEEPVRDIFAGRVSSGVKPNELTSQLKGKLLREVERIAADEPPAFYSGGMARVAKKKEAKYVTTKERMMKMFGGTHRKYLDGVNLHHNMGEKNQTQSPPRFIFGGGPPLPMPEFIKVKRVDHDRLPYHHPINVAKRRDARLVKEMRDPYLIDHSDLEHETQLDLAGGFHRDIRKKINLLRNDTYEYGIHAEKTLKIKEERWKKLGNVDHINKNKRSDILAAAAPEAKQAAVAEQLAIKQERTEYAQQVQAEWLAETRNKFENKDNERERARIQHEEMLKEASRMAALSKMQTLREKRWLTTLVHAQISLALGRWAEWRVVDLEERRLLAVARGAANQWRSFVFQRDLARNKQKAVFFRKHAWKLKMQLSIVRKRLAQPVMATFLRETRSMVMRCVTMAKLYKRRVSSCQKHIRSFLDIKAAQEYLLYMQWDALDRKRVEQLHIERNQLLEAVDKAYEKALAAEDVSTDINGYLMVPMLNDKEVDLTRRNYKGRLMREDEMNPRQKKAYKKAVKMIRERRTLYNFQFTNLMLPDAFQHQNIALVPDAIRKMVLNPVLLRMRREARARYEEYYEKDQEWRKTKRLQNQVRRMLRYIFPRSDIDEKQLEATIIEMTGVVPAKPHAFVPLIPPDQLQQLVDQGVKIQLAQVAADAIRAKMQPMEFVRKRQGSMRPQPVMTRRGAVQTGDGDDAIILRGTWRRVPAEFDAIVKEAQKWKKENKWRLAHVRRLKEKEKEEKALLAKDGKDDNFKLNERNSDSDVVDDQGERQSAGQGQSAVADSSTIDDSSRSGTNVRVAPSHDSHSNGDSGATVIT